MNAAVKPCMIKFTASLSKVLPLRMLEGGAMHFYTFAALNSDCEKLINRERLTALSIS